MKRQILALFVSALATGVFSFHSFAQSTQNDPAFASRMTDSDRHASAVNFQKLRAEAVREGGIHQERHGLQPSRDTQKDAL